MEQNTNPSETKYFTDEDFQTILKSTSSGFTHSQEILKIEGLSDKKITQDQIQHILYPDDLENKYSQKRLEELQEKAKGTDKKIKMEYAVDRQLAVLMVMNVSSENARQMIKEASMGEKKNPEAAKGQELNKEASIEEKKTSEAATGKEKGTTVKKAVENLQRNIPNAARGLNID